MYLVHWKYKVKPEETRHFEHEYGPDGTWSAFFSKSKDYLGSDLYKSEAETGTYMLIDKWKDKDSYEHFKQLNENTYIWLSLKFEHLYELEEKVDTYLSLT